MTKYYLAIDIGASSGRHMLGYLENGQLRYEEIHRFSNGAVMKDGELCWDLEGLFAEIIEGMRRCAAIGKIPQSVGIDTWGVDFVLLDEAGEVLGNTVAYRDARTDGMDAEVYKLISEEELYARTGTQKALINSIFQLMAIKLDPRGYLQQAKQLLFIPDYLHYLLSGKTSAEYSIATTSGLVNASSKDWDDEIIERCGFPRWIFADMTRPGSALGNLSSEIQALVGFDCQVLIPASHDTASAVMAVPSQGAADQTLYISSGTWSLMGIERMTPDCSADSRRFNFTNEGGYDYRYRYLKNIMGLWMIQSVKKELDDVYSFAELCDMAEASEIESIVDCNDQRFLAPTHMIREIQAACQEGGQPVPNSPGEQAAVVYNSLAICYRDTAIELEQMSGRHFDAIHIVGGGSNAEYLNKLTARYTGKTVYAGPSEATAVGNLIAQMIADGTLTDLDEARACVTRSHEIQRYG